MPKKIVFIGSGLGTLVSATILARHGYEVCVLEKNKQIGGNLQVFSRDKTIFDTGVHYLGGLGPHQNLAQYFQYLGIYDQLQFEMMDQEFEKILFSNSTNTYSIAQGRDAFIDTLSQSFPDEKKQIAAYYDYLEYTCSHFPLYHLGGMSCDTPDAEITDYTLEAILNRFFKDSTLKKVLLTQNILHGGKASTTPWYIHALISYSYIQGAYKLINGSSQIAIALSKQIRLHGGTIIKEKEVIGTALKEKELAQVICKDGSRYEADYFIFNCHPKQLQFILPQAFRKIQRNRILNSPETTSSFSVYISLHEDQLPYFKHNKFISYLDDGITKKLMLSAVRDPNNVNFAKGLNILTFDTYSSYHNWKDSFNTTSYSSERNEAYQQYKNDKAKKLITVIKRQLPDIEKLTKNIFSSSPLSYKDYIDGIEGSMYGIEKRVNPMESILVDQKTKIKNVFLVGQNTSLHGVLGVTIGAVKCCFNFIEQKKLIEEIKDSI